ncbi:MAG: phosphoglycerate mutase family protein [Flavobacterium sp.]
MKSIILLALLIINQILTQNKTNESTIYLIRHAEKENSSDDPDLSKEGQERAQFWKNYFINKNIDVIYVTPTKRAQMTIAPLATTLQKEIHFYKPDQMNLKALAEKHPGMNILVVGHSTTIPKYLNQLQETKEYPEIGNNEYDFLFEVKLYYKTPLVTCKRI